MDQDPVRLLGALRPVEDFLPPQHPQVVVDHAVAAQLLLRGVPEWIGGLPRLELLEGVAGVATIFAMVVEGLLRPLGEGVEPIEAVDVGAEVESQFAPGDQLIEEPLRRLRHPPPAAARALGVGPQLHRTPILDADDPVEDLGRGEVSEVEPWGEAAGHRIFRVIAGVRVAGEAGEEELIEMLESTLLAPAEIDRRHGVVDGGVGDEVARVGEGLRRNRRPALQNLGGNRRRSPTVRLQRLGGGTPFEMRGQSLLEMTAQRVRGRVRTLRGGDREQPVAVDPLETNGDHRARGFLHPRKEEAGEVVSHHRAGGLRERLEETLVDVGGRLDVGVVGHPRLTEGLRLVRHPRHHEGVETVGVVLVARAERFEDEERLLE